VFAKEVGCESDDEVFAEFGRRFFRFYRHLCDLDDEMQFVLTRKQEQAFNSRFGALQSEMISGEGYDMVASVRRLGLITFRLAMILSVLRLEGEVIESSRQLICADEDFGVAMTLMEALVEHSLAVYHELDSASSASSATVHGCKDVKNECKCQLIAELSDEFSNRDAELIGVKLNFSRRTVYSYLSELQSEGTIERVKLGKYRKRVQITDNRVQMTDYAFGQQ
jgi:hypothetical protein